MMRGWGFVACVVAVVGCGAPEHAGTRNDLVATTATADVAADTSPDSESAASHHVSHPALGATLAHMPRACSKDRVYINVSKLLSHNANDAFDLLGAAIEARVKSEEKEIAHKALAAAKARRLTFDSLLEIGVCSDSAGRTLIAAEFDPSRVKGRLDDAIKETLDDVLGTKAGMEHRTGVSLIGTGIDASAITNDGLFLTGMPKDDLALLAATAPDNAAAFEGATSFVVWIKTGEGTPDAETLTLAESSDDDVLRVEISPPKSYAAEFAKSAEDGLNQMNAAKESLAKSLDSTRYAMLAPVIRETRISMNGANVLIASTFPRSVLTKATHELANDPELMTKLTKKDP